MVLTACRADGRCMGLSLLSVRAAEAMIMVTNVSAIDVTKSLTGTDTCQPNQGNQISNRVFP